jgi:anthranilate synthase component 1
MMDVVRRELDNISPVAAFDALNADVVLENGERGWESTYVAAEPAETFVHRRNDHERGCFERFTDWIDGLPDTEEDVAAGAYGFVGYDVAKEYEDVQNDTERDIDLPDAWFGFYDTVAVLGDRSVHVEAVEHERQQTSPEERATRFVEAVDGADYDGRGVRATDIRSNFDRNDYLDAVGRVKERIREGETFQTNISQRLSFDSDASALDLYARLRETNPAPYMGLIDRDGWSVVSSSPELLVEVRDEQLATRPIAGTRPREEGEKDRLAASEKERAEHSILVDLARNDIGKVSRYGTVDVEEFATVVPYSEVYHLESVVTGTKRESVDAVDALSAVFPGGTVTGAPKPRTLRIIEDVEPTERGPYTGSMGRLGLDGDATFNILIRTAVRDATTYHLQVGGGVVHDSEPKREYEETLDKAQGVLNALEER